MPSIAQQDYKVIAPKDGRGFMEDAAALAELKKAVLNGIGFDCLLKNIADDDGALDRVLGFYEDCSDVYCFSTGNGGIVHIELPHTVAQYQGLAAVQNAIDEEDGTVMSALPTFRVEANNLFENNTGYWPCVDGKFLIPAVSGGKLASLTIAETGPANGFVNITWEDAQKLIGLPITE